MQINFYEKIENPLGILVLLQADTTLTPLAQEIDQQLKGHLTKLLNDPSFSFQKNAVVKIPSPIGTDFSEIIIMGFSPENLQKETDFEVLGSKLYTAFGQTQTHQVTLITEGVTTKDFDTAHATALIASGLLLKSWRFDSYFTKLDKKDRCQIKKIDLVTSHSSVAESHFTSLKAIAKGVFLTRQLTSEPPNVLYPKTLAEKAKELEKLGMKVEIFEEKELKKMGFNALVGVGQGSEKDSHLVVMRWEGSKKDEAPIAFVGKGVTFDTGGISLKPSADMDEMKWDMAGAGTVLGLMHTLAARKAKVNAVGVMGLVENMPSGSAQRPGDIVKSLSGQTIEILNTDAEGRLVLADALWYTQDRFKPKAMIDLATLTGAIIVALGTEHAGLFSNNEELADHLAECGKQTGEKVWQLPLSEAYDKEINSTIADVKNLGAGRNAGSIAGAQFLQRFVNNTPWAHLDIAGTAWNKKGTPLSQAGATAFGVRLLNKFVSTYYEG